jgi:hypothetical protein
VSESFSKNQPHIGFSFKESTYEEFNKSYLYEVTLSFVTKKNQSQLKKKTRDNLQLSITSKVIVL